MLGLMFKACDGDAARSELLMEVSARGVEMEMETQVANLREFVRSSVIAADGF